MHPSHTPRLLLLAPAIAFAFASSASGQVFVDKLAGVPQGSPTNNSSTFEVDFGDVDLDGDFDAVFGDGDSANDQNRIWINFGGLQGSTIGTFRDETNARFPAVLDETRDLDFADIDSDGDLDLHVSNVSSITNQGSRWWVNQGGAQSGSLGYFVDDTAARWVSLGGAGSSIPPGQLVGGTFITWCGDSEFGDLDNDGDLDVVHATYGFSFGGQMPTRIFLNDGDGLFSEFNPSLFQLSGANISNGNPALWAEGLQLANNLDATGANADIATSSLDVDLGDLDGDYDLDLVLGARDEPPRLFANRLAENGGAVLSFRDVTSSHFPVGYSTGMGHYDQEVGDLDNDGDLDILGVNWLFYADNTLRNDGSGVFTTLQTLASSGSDDNEGDFIDYDQDGALDVFMTNWSSASRLYRGDGSGLLSFVTSGLQVTTLPGTDTDTCDLDGDGDTDALQVNNQSNRNQLWNNITTGNDVHAPYIPRHENPGAQVAAVGEIAVRAEVYDNASYYRVWEATTALGITVDGFALPLLPARTSYGQIFRAQAPGHLVGAVDLQWRSTDTAGNTGVSSVASYTSSYIAPIEIAYGTGSADANAITPTVELLSLAVPGERVWFGITGSPNSTYILAYAAASWPTFFLPGIGNVNIDPFTANSSIVGGLDANGRGVFTSIVPGILLAGQSVYLQAITIAPNQPNPPSLGTSQGLQAIFQ